MHTGLTDPAANPIADPSSVGNHVLLRRLKSVADKHERTKQAIEAEYDLLDALEAEYQSLIETLKTRMGVL